MRWSPQSSIFNQQSAIPPMSTPREMLDRLDTRHDELIRKLDALNADIERVLAEFARSRTPQPQAAPEAPPAPEIANRRAA